MRFFANARYHFIEARKKAYVFSGTLIAIGLVAIGVNFATIGSWVPYGVDFTGGALVQVRFSGASVDAGDLRAALGGAQAPPITRFGEENEFVIRAPLEEGVSLEQIAGEIESELATAFEAGSFEIVRTELVGAKVGGELQRKAILAVLFSFVITLVYLAIRFELRFGMAAVIATIHDILITLGFMALMRLEFDLPSVAAILTVVGYSLNDTIIVFDRIRENTHYMKKESYASMVDLSIRQTIVRSLNTAITMLIPLAAILLFGGPTLKDFAFALVIGVASGAYSSVFIASPLLVIWKEREPTYRKRAAAEGA